MRNQSEPSSFAALKTPISQRPSNQLFYEARTHSTWLPEPVPVELLRKGLTNWRVLGRPASNGLPARIRFSDQSRRQGAPQAGSIVRECRQNHGRFL